MSRLKRLFGHYQAGDTIVEVVIAIAVIATVLTGAFVVSSHSLTAVRDSQEHSEALELLQGQVEDLRNAAAQTGKLTTYVTSGSRFCFNNLNVISSPSSSGSPCTQDSAQKSGQLDSRYALAIQTCSSPQCPSPGFNSPTTNFILTATWPALNDGTDQVQLTYRVFVN